MICDNVPLLPFKGLLALMTLLDIPVVIVVFTYDAYREAVTLWERVGGNSVNTRDTPYNNVMSFLPETHPQALAKS